ncbi:MAG: hypothetical protein K8T10_00225 [Candidatus Eremiobacteraeota bacterium]|nr:hypothetical protein [Candidatus Eremiobacteraeota bacterium]
MTDQDDELKKIIEAAEESVKEGKKQREETPQKPAEPEKTSTSPPSDEIVDENKKNEWEKWSTDQLGKDETTPEAKKAKTITTVFIAIAIALALVVFIIFNINFSKHYKKMNSRRKISVKQLKKQKTPTAPATPGVITHKGVPSAQKPPGWKQPIRKRKTPKPGEIPDWQKENPPPTATPGGKPIIIQ